MIFRLKDRFGLLTMHTPIRRCLQALTRESQPTLSLFKDPSSLRSLSVAAFPNHDSSSPHPIFTNSKPSSAFGQWYHARYFSSSKQDGHIKKEDIQEEVEDEDDSDDSDYDDEEEDYEDDDDSVSVSSKKKVYTAEEKEAEATAIGYKVMGPLQKDDQVFKPYEPAFAVVQIGSHQFKVSNGDSIFTERLKFCEVNDKLILNKVLLLGSASQTIVGRPIVPDAAVHAVVEEHALDAKVIIFKKKRRKNYRRTKGHRQELTKLRITDIEGVEKPQPELVEKPSKSAKKEQEKVAVSA
ncbi:large ribosomal subunit protein bL21m-like [Vicia villosa]|uniref:large ribosomal subunit protein bL21m-like n=1 Tax=Vicia villosa TaxID=3911 RepID=UPI00273B224C|nr:large ribosomal subunit protein bL21m-like [Vicia villosa]